LVQTKEFQTLEDYLLKCVISSDLRFIATTSVYKTTKLWDNNTWSLEYPLNKHQQGEGLCILR
jgi:WD40 repeat protein